MVSLMQASVRLTSGDPCSECHIGMIPSAAVKRKFVSAGVCRFLTALSQRQLLTRRKRPTPRRIPKDCRMPVLSDPMVTQSNDLGRFRPKSLKTGAAGED